MPSLREKLSVASMAVEELASVLAARSGGKFLYVGLALDDLEQGRCDVGDVVSLPLGMENFYLHAFARRFAKAGRDYVLTRAVLGLLAVAQEPLSSSNLAGMLDRSEEEILTTLRAVSDFLTSRNKSYTFEHVSLAEWLTGEDEQGMPRAGAYHVCSGQASLDTLKGAFQ